VKRATPCSAAVAFFIQAGAAEAHYFSGKPAPVERLETDCWKVFLNKLIWQRTKFSFSFVEAAKA